MNLSTRAGRLGNGMASQPAVPGRNLTERYRRLSVTIVFTSTRATLSALKHAEKLTHGLGASIRVVAPYVVPYPLPLERPPVDAALGLTELRTAAGEAGIRTRIEVTLCRDRKLALAEALSPRSLVLIAGPRHWWPTPESSLARALRRWGHQVILLDQN